MSPPSNSLAKRAIAPTRKSASPIRTIHFRTMATIRTRSRGWPKSISSTSHCLPSSLEKLKNTKEGDGSLLDHSLFLYGSGIGNPNLHDHTKLPIIVAGGAAGNMQGGRHIKFDKPTPLANLHLTLLNKVGVPLEKFGDSTGLVDELGEPLSI